ncbi:hypothetical protein QYQ98_03090 [Corynebacterium sp. P3-F1]|uniref:hypothetical protein n=1 Tax=Corynebacterium sp. P3-F1 TaxID=3059080 RepID=UPI00265D065A|nr:hypothetical protein [Corynebacterium sp. P3-F1]WKK61891.1 hypothetical protein QYQ98_03090 [Corynebacterium sp. P3-F1]
MRVTQNKPIATNVGHPGSEDFFCVVAVDPGTWWPGPKALCCGWLAHCWGGGVPWLP